MVHDSSLHACKIGTVVACKIGTVVHDSSLHACKMHAQLLNEHKPKVNTPCILLRRTCSGVDAAGPAHSDTQQEVWCGAFAAVPRTQGACPKDTQAIYG